MSKPKRIVLSTFGSFGDIHPYMALAMELQARGHHPIIATSELYREKIETAGLKLHPVRPNLPPPQDQDEELIRRIMHPRSGPRVLMDEIILASLRDSYADLFEVAQEADLLITHPAAPAGHLVARKTQIPWISTVLAPASFLSAYDPPVPPFWSWINHLQLFGPHFMRLVLTLAKQSYRPQELFRLRDELGLGDYGHPAFEGQHSPYLVLALFSKLFAAAQPDWPAHTRITGFAFYDGHRELEMSSELSTFLDEGESPIIFTLGSSAVWVARDFFHESIAAAKQLKRRAVLLIGDKRNLPVEPLPSDIIAVNYAPYQSLLPRACAMVHHGGVGTTSQGLRAGAPTLIVPFAFDQPDNAAHAQRMGTSRTLSRKYYLAPRVAKEIDVLLSEPQYAANAKHMSKQLQTENGAANACDLIEEFIGRTPVNTTDYQERAYASSY
jgi:rhamnosyltransferase subunit B